MALPSIDEIFERGSPLAEHLPPLEPATAHQPDDVRGVGEVSVEIDPPNIERLADSETAMVYEEPVTVPTADDFPVFPVACTNDGGAQGDEENPATWTYACVSLDGGIDYGGGHQPFNPWGFIGRYRRPIGRMLVAPDGSIGLAYTDENGDFQLWQVAERIDSAPCP